jgi:hypothetical protein
MQAGRLSTKRWILEYEPQLAKPIDSLMGWTGSANTLEQVRLEFDTKELAVLFADRNAIEYAVIDPIEKKYKTKSYSKNFSNSLKIPWTH